MTIMDFRSKKEAPELWPAVIHPADLESGTALLVLLSGKVLIN